MHRRSYICMWMHVQGEELNCKSMRLTFKLLRRSLCSICLITLQWFYDVRDGVSNHQPHQCLLNRLFRRRSKKTSKLRVTGPCTGNSPVTGEFPAQMTGNAENVSISWRHHDIIELLNMCPSAKGQLPSGLDLRVLVHPVNYVIPVKSDCLCD